MARVRYYLDRGFYNNEPFAVLKIKEDDTLEVTFVVEKKTELHPKHDQDSDESWLCWFKTHGNAIKISKKEYIRMKEEILSGKFPG